MKKLFMTLLSICVALLCLLYTIDVKAEISPQISSLANAYGFALPSDYSPFYMTGFKEYTYSYEEKNTLNYQTNIVHILLRNDNDPTLWCFAYRVTTSPLQVRYWGFLGIGSCGDDWSTRKVRTTIKFRDSSYKILNYAPANNPKKSTSSIGVGFGIDGPVISANVDFEHSELEVVSNTKTASNIYETIYYFNGNNAFTRGDYYSYGLVMFRHEDITWVDVEYEIGYCGNAWYKYHDTQPCTNIYKYTI